MKATKIHRRCACGCGRITNPGRKYIVNHHQKGKKRSEKYKLKMSLSNLKSHPNDEYCEVWRDREYKKDLRKDYCENIDCKGTYERLDNHHINLNKKDCRPVNVMTLCCPCHSLLHHILHLLKRHGKCFIIINRRGHISYIHRDNYIYKGKRGRVTIETTPQHYMV